MIDCLNLKFLGCNVSCSSWIGTAESALKQVPIARFVLHGRVPPPLLVRSYSGFVLQQSQSYTAFLKSYCLKQELITPYTPQQNYLVERVERALKKQCIQHHRFQTLQHASRVIGDWIQFYNHQPPHAALEMKTPTEAFALAA